MPTVGHLQSAQCGIGEIGCYADATCCADESWLGLCITLLGPGPDPCCLAAGCCRITRLDGFKDLLG